MVSKTAQTFQTARAKRRKEELHELLILAITGHTQIDSSRLAYFYLNVGALYAI